MAGDSSAPFESPEAREPLHVVIATVGRPVGLDGWCRIFPSGNTLSAAERPLKVEAGYGNPTMVLVLKELRKDGKGYRGQFEGYNNREQIDAVKNFQLFMPRENLPDNQPDEYYHFELEGMAVYRMEGNERLGTVSHVHNYPTVDALEVTMENGKSVVVPLTKETVKEIDKENRAIYIDGSLIEELL